MELTSTQKKTFGITVVVIIILAGGLFLFRGLTGYLGARVVVPDLSESVVGGRLKGSAISAGDHLLQFKAKTKDGKIITTEVRFSAEYDPYDPYSPIFHDPYNQDPYSR